MLFDGEMYRGCGDCSIGGWCEPVLVTRPTSTGWW